MPGFLRKFTAQRRQNKEEKKRKEFSSLLLPNKLDAITKMSLEEMLAIIDGVTKREKEIILKRLAVDAQNTQAKLEIARHKSSEKVQQQLEKELHTTQEKRQTMHSILLQEQINAVEDLLPQQKLEHFQRMPFQIKLDIINSQPVDERTELFKKMPVEERLMAIDQVAVLYRTQMLFPPDNASTSNAKPKNADAQTTAKWNFIENEAEQRGIPTADSETHTKKKDREFYNWVTMILDPEHLDKANFGSYCLSTGLHIAVNNNQSTVVAELLKNGADVRQDFEGKTILQIARKNRTTSPNIINLLVEKIDELRRKDKKPSPEKKY